MIAHDKRRILAETLPDKSLVILVGQSERLRNGDVHFPFRQDSDVLLLTGLDVPDIILVWERTETEMLWRLYSDPISDTEQIWWTSRLGHDELSEMSLISEVYSLSELQTHLFTLMDRSDTIFVRKSTLEDYESRWFHAHDIILPDTKIQSLEKYLRKLRMIKSHEEIQNIRQAITITKVAYEKIRTVIDPKMYEYEVESHVAQVFRAHHAVEAYPTIVASGSNACTLHYTRHDGRLSTDSLLLVDFGAEYRGYAADITRVFSITPMTPRQMAIYEAVLRVKHFAESQIRPWQKKSDYELLVRANMDAELHALGLIPDTASPEDKMKLSRLYYPHSTSHFLGLDVHDVGERDDIFVPGMVITCEPGIYIPEERIGIRLEDDILITVSGCENLSKSIPL